MPQKSPLILFFIAFFLFAFALFNLCAIITGYGEKFCDISIVAPLVVIVGCTSIAIFYLRYGIKLIKKKE
ncbi:TPA: hypothetical protein DCZ39_07105 [Patescibacteria group bacterium]|nr:hypothetical protein [Candidatus Gracilibacteria bacterium]